MVRILATLLATLAVAGCGKSDEKGAFTKYQRESMSAEARVWVKAIAHGAATYYDSEQLSPTSIEVLPRQLPAPDVGPTPPLGTCCAQGGKCAPDVETWSAPSWRALLFSIEDPHYYSYAYSRAADGKSFTVRAFGDLDCDGTYSTFELVGTVGADDTVALSPLAIQDALE